MMGMDLCVYGRGSDYMCGGKLASNGERMCDASYPNGIKIPLFVYATGHSRARRGGSSKHDINPASGSRNDGRSSYPT
jgi:hypothetical protein